MCGGVACDTPTHVMEAEPVFLQMRSARLRTRRQPLALRLARTLLRVLPDTPCVVGGPRLVQTFDEGEAVVRGCQAGSHRHRLSVGAAPRGWRRCEARLRLAWLVGAPAEEPRINAAAARDGYSLDRNESLYIDKPLSTPKNHTSPRNLTTALRSGGGVSTGSVRRGGLLTYEYAGNAPDVVYSRNALTSPRYLEGGSPAPRS